MRGDLHTITWWANLWWVGLAF